MSSSFEIDVRHSNSTITLFNFENYVLYMPSVVFSNISTVLLTFSLSLILFWIIDESIKGRKYPPGPIGLPFLGYGPFLGKKPHVTLTKLSKEYGDVFSVYIGSRLNVFTNSYRVTKNMLSHPLAINKPSFVTGRGFSSMSGKEWQEERRFVVQAMKNVGITKGLYETMLQDVSSDFDKDLRALNGLPCDFRNMFWLPLILNTFSLLCGKRFDPVADHEHIQVIKKYGMEFLENTHPVNKKRHMHWLHKLSQTIQSPKQKKYLELERKHEEIFSEELARRMNSHEEQSKNDFIGYYLEGMKDKEFNEKTHTLTLENLYGNLSTLSHTMHLAAVVNVEWLMLLMIKHQDIQANVSREIDNVLGRDAVICYDHHRQLPYTMATIMEMMRWVTLNPLNPPRCASGTFTFENYTIPKGAQIIGNTWAMMHDSRMFEEPMEFRPERFLAVDRTEIIKSEAYNPFSFGRRNCPGETMAYMMVFILFVSIMQKFTINTADGNPPDMDYEYKSGLFPKPQKFSFKPKE